MQEPAERTASDRLACLHTPSPHFRVIPDSTSFSLPLLLFPDKTLLLSKDLEPSASCLPHVPILESCVSPAGYEWAQFSPK